MKIFGRKIKLKKRFSLPFSSLSLSSLSILASMVSIIMATSSFFYLRPCTAHLVVKTFLWFPPRRCWLKNTNVRIKNKQVNKQRLLYSLCNLCFLLKKIALLLQLFYSDKKLLRPALPNGSFLAAVVNWL